jgi:hypothetical protein
MTLRKTETGFVVAVLFLLCTAGSALAQGPYTPVSEEEMTKLKLNHYFTPDKKGLQPDFEWTFTKGEFLIKKGKAAIPADLRKKLLAGDAEEIRGEWKLEEKDGRKLVLSDIKVGNKTQMKEVRLPIYKTAPTVVRIGEPQYVFAIER